MSQLENPCEFLSRLTGKPVEAGTSFALSSARKAQLAAWLRREGVPFTYAQIDKATITPGEIIGKRMELPTVGEVPAAAQHATRILGSSIAVDIVPFSGIRIGIDLEGIINLPKAEDYRLHPFYVENFSPREIAHCLQSAEPLTSLCGLWAAKEAIIKSGAARRVETSGLASIEIQHDRFGAPHFPACTLSISHQEEMAVAVCLHFVGAAS